MLRGPAAVRHAPGGAGLPGAAGVGWELRGGALCVRGVVIGGLGMSGECGGAWGGDRVLQHTLVGAGVMRTCGCCSTHLWVQV